MTITAWVDVSEKSWGYAKVVAKDEEDLEYILENLQPADCIWAGDYEFEVGKVTIKEVNEDE